MRTDDGGGRGSPEPRGPGGLGWAAVVVFVAALVAMGCDGERSSDGRADAAGQTADEQTDASGGESDGAENRRSAYGLPFPPRVHGVGERSSSVEVATRMKLDPLEEFFRTRLVDYEILRPEENRIRVVGLREYMPEIRGHRYGPFTTLNYFRERQKPEKPGASEGDSDAGVERAGASQGNEAAGGGGSSGPSRQPGEPVRLRTSDGDLLAPGAKWGEPYTPPEGSPLDRPRYEANFGEPFGEWQAP